MGNRKYKICYVVQRYGLEVNGGAELQFRQFAEHMAQAGHDVHVATTCAVDYMSCANHYEETDEEINGVKVHRFAVENERNMKEFDEINGAFLNYQMSSDREAEWIEKQGPNCPKLIQYLKKHQDEYDAFFFSSYLYYTAVYGVSTVPHKAIAIPEAHDEPYQRMRIFENVFLKPRCFFFNTEEERDLVHELYQNYDIPYEIGGTGMDVPESSDGQRFREKFGLDQYVVYVGRIDEAKNCRMLFRYFEEYKKRNPVDIKLVLMGKPVIPIPDHKDIVSLGFVDEQDKYDGIEGARALILPSEFESLSLVVLEAMSLNTPVIVNGACPVLKGHCIKSNGAFYYNDYFEFEGELNYILNNAEIVSIMCENAKKYANDNYQWDVIVDKMEKLVAYVCEQNQVKE